MEHPIDFWNPQRRENEIKEIRNSKTRDEWALIIGSLAATVSSVSLVPQFMKTILTNETSGLSMYRFILATVTCSLWMIYGLLVRNPTVWVTQMVSTAIFGIIAFYIVNNEYNFTDVPERFKEKIKSRNGNIKDITPM